MSQVPQSYINDGDEITGESRFYYFVKVVEKGSNPVVPIKDASIGGDNMDEIQITQPSGISKWTEEVPSLFGVKAACPGYETSNPRKINGRSGGYGSEPVVIELQKKATAGYHYKITVKDNDTHAAISAARVYIYKVDGSSYDDDPHNQTQSDGSFVYYSDSEEYLVFEIRKNGYNDSGEVTVQGNQSAAVNQTINLKKTAVADYYYVISVRDSAGNPVRGVGFRLYTDIGYSNPYNLGPEEVLTDANGLAVVGPRTSQFRPNDIYAKGVTIPAGYEWTNTNARVEATLSSTAPGCNFIIQSYTVYNTYYYNFRVLNSTDSSPVADVKINFYDSNVLVATKTTNSSGEAFYTTNYQNLAVKIAKSGFETGYEQGVNLPGSSVATSFRKILIGPENTVRVEYDDHTPAVGVRVYVFKYDQDKNIIYIKNGELTHAGGYLNPIDAVYYNSAIYAKIPNYTKTIFPLTKGHMILQIPKNTNEDDESTEQEKHYSKMSVKGLKQTLNVGDTKYFNGTDYAVRILDPDVITTLDIFTSTPVMMYNGKRNVIGSVDVSIKPDVNDLRLKMLNRYSGYYNPIFKDILFYKNLPTDTGKEYKFSNTSFQSNYRDNYGRFGIINNMWFHKVNDNPDVEIFSTLTPYYPLTGEYALDCKDYNVFSSNWDINYFTRQIDRDNSKPCDHLGSMKNGLCMFGSKYLNVPNTIQIMGIDMGDADWDGEWNDDWITNPEGCPGEMMYKEVNDRSVDFYFFFTKRIVRFFKDKLKDEFAKYIGSETSYGKDGLDDDIEEYVRKNILKLYKLEKVIMFVRRRKKGQHNSRIENDYTSYLEFDPTTGEDCDVSYYRKHGFVEVNTMTMTKMNRDDFDRKLVYNLRNGSQEDFGFGFILKKI